MSSSINKSSKSSKICSFAKFLGDWFKFEIFEDVSFAILTDCEVGSASTWWSWTNGVCTSVAVLLFGTAASNSSKISSSFQSRPCKSCLDDGWFWFTWEIVCWNCSWVGTCSVSVESSAALKSASISCLWLASSRCKARHTSPVATKRWLSRSSLWACSSVCSKFWVFATGVSATGSGRLCSFASTSANKRSATASCRVVACGWAVSDWAGVSFSSEAFAFVSALSTTLTAAALLAGWVVKS